MGIESLYSKLFKTMYKEGKVQTLSKKAVYRIEHKIAMKFKPIKEEFYRKSRGSIGYINKLESKTAEI